MRVGSCPIFWFISGTLADKYKCISFLKDELLSFAVKDGASETEINCTVRRQTCWQSGAVKNISHYCLLSSIQHAHKDTGNPPLQQFPHSMGSVEGNVFYILNHSHLLSTYSERQISVVSFAVCCWLLPRQHNGFLFRGTKQFRVPCFSSFQGQFAEGREGSEYQQSGPKQCLHISRASNSRRDLKLPPDMRSVWVAPPMDLAPGLSDGATAYESDTMKDVLFSHQCGY